MQNARFKVVTGRGIESFLPEIATLRIQIFREYPYLYEGTEEYERKYLKAYLDCTASVAVLCFVEERLVGVATGLPLKYAADDFQTDFAHFGYPEDSVFYFGESVLLPAYRGMGIGRQFHELRLTHARMLQTYSHAAFCAVIRKPDDPRRPKEYQGPEHLWKKIGFKKIEGLTTRFSWQEIGESEESYKNMQFWVKEI